MDVPVQPDSQLDGRCDDRKDGDEAPAEGRGAPRNSNVAPVFPPPAQTNQEAESSIIERECIRNERIRSSELKSQARCCRKSGYSAWYCGLTRRMPRTAGRDAVGAPLERGASLKAAESGVLVALVRFLNHLECLYQESHPVVHETRTGVAIAA